MQSPDCSKFYDVLVDLSKHLPSDLTLPADPHTNLWDFYQSLSCIATLDRDHVFIFVHIPLLHRTNVLQLYKVHNLPVPISLNSTSTVAKFDVESLGIGVNDQRTQFALLTDNELIDCSRPLQTHCKIQSPLYPTNVNRFCVISLFLGDKARIANNCRKILQSNFILPQAKYINNGRWIISNRQKFRLNIVCPSQNTLVTDVEPAVSLFRLNKSCTATSDVITLTPFFQSKSTFTLDNSKLVTNYELTPIGNLSILKPGLIPFHNPEVHKGKEKNRDLNVEDLKNSEDNLLNKMSDFQALDSNSVHNPSNSWFLYFLLSLIIILIVSFIGFVIYWFIFMKSKRPFPNKSIEVSPTNPLELTEECPDVTAVNGGENDGIVVAPSVSTAHEYKLC